jgi:hypothetical protein
MFCGVTGFRFGSEKITTMKHVHTMHVTFATQPSAPRRTNGPAWNGTSGCGHTLYHRRQKIGMMYDVSSAIAHRLKIAFAAIGLARSSSPGRMQTSVTTQTAYSGVCVRFEIRASRPRSGKPVGRKP